MGVALALLLLVAPTAVSAQAQQTVLARGREDLAAGEWMFRVNDNTLPPGQPGVTHAHASGFDYAVEGTHVLAVGGTERVAMQGQATWVGPMEEHTHGSVNQSGMRFWFVAFRPAATRGVPGVWPHPGSRIRSESENVSVAAAGPHELVLSEIRLPRPGDAVGPLARAGVVGVTVVDGAARFGGQPIPAEGVVVQRAGDARTFTNAGPGPARLLALTVVPDGAAAQLQLPRTGAGVAAAGGVPAPAALGVWLVLAAGVFAVGHARLSGRRRYGRR